MAKSAPASMTDIERPDDPFPYETPHRRSGSAPAPPSRTIMRFRRDFTDVANGVRSWPSVFAAAVP
jgi:hypothetical protein